MKSLRKYNSAILVFAIIIFVCGAVIAAEPANKDKSPKAPAKESKKPSGKKYAGKHAAHHKITASDEAELSEWLKEFYPKEAEKLEALKENPKLHENRLRLIRKKFSAIMEAYKKNPEFGKALMDEKKLRSERVSLIRKLKAAKDKPSHDRYRAELAETVSKEFDNNVKIKRFRYEELRARIKRMEKVLAQREEEVKKLVERKNLEIKKRIDDLIKDEEKIKWK